MNLEGEKIHRERGERKENNESRRREGGERGEKRDDM